ncbi:hypothetical protein SK069_05775 [Patulibacter brassicae]|uniref:Uncharacterized protein n=1 Tax=Patulibacter brassicae TaxID=1705717 RepID=A0ABU4VH17_9ACTN|nr:hypothetical protein [Patulibacter brassicae]MDX8151093.1 hypothetical protein [Patulibacter brassicae]
MSTFVELEDGLFALVQEIRDEHPQLHGPPARLWGKTHVSLLPAIWIDLQPESEVNDSASLAGCSVADDVRVAIRIAVDTAAEGTGQDAHHLGGYVDPVLGLVDRAMNESKDRFGGGVYLARRLRFSFELASLGTTQAQTLVIPLLLQWQHDTPTA